MKTTYQELMENKNIASVVQATTGMLLIGMILTLADKLGRGKAEPLLLKARLFPYDNRTSHTDICNMLAELVEHTKLVLYECRNEWYFDIADRYYPVAGNAKSGLPAPEDGRILTPDEIRRYPAPEMMEKYEEPAERPVEESEIEPIAATMQKFMANVAQKREAYLNQQAEVVPEQTEVASEQTEVTSEESPQENQQQEDMEAPAEIVETPVTIQMAEGMLKEAGLSMDAEALLKRAEKKKLVYRGLKMELSVEECLKREIEFELELRDLQERECRMAQEIELEKEREIERQKEIEAKSAERERKKAEWVKEELERMREKIPGYAMVNPPKPQTSREDLIKLFAQDDVSEDLDHSASAPQRESDQTDDLSGTHPAAGIEVIPSASPQDLPAMEGFQPEVVSQDKSPEDTFTAERDLFDFEANKQPEGDLQPETNTAADIEVTPSASPQTETDLRAMEGFQPEVVSQEKSPEDTFTAERDLFDFEANKQPAEDIPPEINTQPKDNFSENSSQEVTPQDAFMPTDGADLFDFETGTTGFQPTKITQPAASPQPGSQPDIVTDANGQMVFAKPKKKVSAQQLIEDRKFSPELEQAIKEWVLYKIEKRQGYKETGLKSFLTQAEKKAKEYGDEAVISVIWDSMSSNYMGVTWDKLKRIKPTKQAPRQTMKQYGPYQNVFLSDDELLQLKNTIPNYQYYIDNLSTYMASTGRNYENHAATIQIWYSKDKPVQRSYECEEGESF